MQQEVIDSFQENIALVDLQGNIYAVNKAWVSFALDNGASPDYTDLGRNYVQVLMTSGAIEDATGIQAVLDGRLPYYDSSYACPSPQLERWYLMRVSPITEQGKIKGALVSHRNITQEEQQRREIYDVLESMTDAFYALDENWRFVYLNKEAEKLLQRNREELLGKLMIDEFPDVKDTGIFHQYKEVARLQKTHQFDIFYPPLDTWFEIHVYPRGNGGLSVYFKDITEKKIKEQKLWHTANYDHLTGLPNRLHFYSHLNEQLRTEQTTAVFFMDLNGFKLVNDVYGHDTGDDFLKEVAERLTQQLEPDFFISRFGGDEFVLTKSFADEKTMHEDAARIGAVFKEVFWLTGTAPVQLGAAIGISVFPLDGSSADQLISNSDMAMYEAKQAKRTKWVRYSKQMGTRWERRLLLEKQMMTAVHSGDLRPFYQPEVDMEQGRIVSFEMLARWFHPELGTIAPNEFITIAEETGHIQELSERLIEQALQDFSVWRKQGYQGTLSINVTSELIMEETFVGFLVHQKQLWELPDHSLELELTENIQLFQSPFVQQQLKWLQQHGFCIAIDDFGSGYSNFSYISEFPINKIKIDKLFIDYIGSSEKGEAVLDALVLLSLRLGIDLVAEGVETEAQIDYLRSRQCRLVQGYYISHPLPLEKATLFLEQFEKNNSIIEKQHKD